MPNHADNESSCNDPAASGVNRREFIRTGSIASAAVAAGLTHSTSLAKDEPSSSASEIVNIGIIGAGGRGAGAMNDSLRINSNVRVIAMADLYAEKCASKRDQLARRHSDKMSVADDKIYGGLDGYKRVLDDPDVDLVIQTTSPGFRPHHVLAAVQAGKHVFAEKPSCVDPAGYRICLTAHELAERNGTAIVTGTQYRRQANYVEAIKQIHDGVIGDIVGATSRYCSTGIWHKPRKPGMSNVEYQLYNWMHYVWLSGDHIAEQAVHNIDAMNWIMGGPPLVAYGSGGRFTRPENSEMWDNVSVDYEYPNNRVVSFKCRQIPGTKSDNSNTIFCTGGTAFIGPSNTSASIVDRGGKELWSMKGNIDAAYQQEHKDLVDSIRAGKPIVELKETANSSLTAVMGRMAAYTGQRVSWRFVTEESKLDLFPKDLSMGSDLPMPKHAVPGETKLV